MPYAERDGERLYYEVAGKGPKLVLVRGLSRSMRFWPPEVIEELQQRFTVLQYDHRGIGRSELANAKFSMADMADDLDTVMEAADFDKAHVFGISLGGMVAQHVALRHPDRIDRLILAATLTAPKAMQASYAKFGPLIFGSSLNSERGMRMQLRVLTTRRFAKKHPHIAKRWIELLREEPLDKRAVIGQMRAALGNDTRETVTTVPHETLVLTGNADRLIPMKSSEWLARSLPNARLRVLDGVGHEIPSQAPRATVDSMTSFFLA